LDETAPQPGPLAPADPPSPLAPPGPLAPSDPPAPADPWADETVVNGPDPVRLDAGPTGTGILPPIDPDRPPSGVPTVLGAPAADATPRWQARAQVPQPGLRDQQPGLEAWEEEDLRPPRSAAFPALVAAAVVILLALIGLGIWLATRDRTAPVVGPSTSVTATPSTSRSATPATSGPATSAPPTSAAPAPVAVPVVAGLSLADARNALIAANLTPGQTSEHSDSVPAGQVIRSEPAAGKPVAPGSVVVLVVSSGPEPTQGPPSDSPPPSSDGGPTSPAPSGT
jgi:hypothetical protein